MQDRKPSLFPSIKLVAVAALLGILAGGVAVYMKEAGSGNGVDTAAAIDCSPAAAAIARLSPLAKGQVAAFIPARQSQALVLPPFKDGAGKDVKLADFSGKLQLVNLWATWCIPCREEMPALNGLQKTMGSDRFQVTAINLDNGDSVDKPRQFLADTKIDALTLYHDGSLNSFNTLKKAGVAMGLPASVLVDARGCMLGAMNGPAAWESDDAMAMIKAALGPGS
jgi:thiol-disulfide isomerase/thioredoxin